MNTLALVLVVLGSTLSAQPGKFKAGRLLVQPRSGLSHKALASILHPNQGRSLELLSPGSVHIVEVPKGREIAVQKILARNPSIQFAELDSLVEPGEVNANDPYFESAWHHARIGAPSAWDSSLGSQIIVAVLDTGVDSSHPDLAGQLVPGWNVSDGNSDTSDVHGHGTQVAGTIAAASNNGIGVTSIAWDAFVMPVRISQLNGYAYFSTIAQGLIWAADHGARVANISYGVSGSATVQTAANHMRSLGGLVTVAGGNSGIDEGFAPSPSMISVSATNSLDGRPSWSSYGSYVDLSAPGVGVWTTRRGGGYGAVSGTSFSSPITAAVIALMMAANPTLSPGELEAILLDTAEDLGSTGYDIYYGHGRIDAARAVSAVMLTPPPLDDLPPSVSIVSPDDGGVVSGTVMVDVSSSDNVGVVAVDLYADGTFLASDSSSPYRFALDTSAFGEGPLLLEASARDESQNEGTSQPVEVLVDNVPDPPDTTSPTVAITSPTNGATVRGTVTIVVQAQDDRSLSSVNLLIDGQLKQSGNGSFSYAWNTRKVASGKHTLRATAKDSAGNFTSTTMTVTTSSKGGKGKP